MTVSGNGTYTTPTGFTLPTHGTVTGTYQWNASYSGDANNNAGQRANDAGRSGDGRSRQRARAIATTAQPDHGHAGRQSPVTLTDTARWRAAINPTGTITFTLFGPGGLDAGGHRDGAGQRQRLYTTPTGFTLPTTATVTGTYQWDASYSGDANNNPASESEPTHDGRSRPTSR